MKKRVFIATIAATLTMCMTVAQNRTIAKIGMTEDGQLSNPQTILVVSIDVEKESVIAGPYARYAQKYLGVRATLTDKTSCRIAGGSISDVTSLSSGALATAHVNGNAPKAVSHTNSLTEFPKLLPDKVASTEMSQEEAAATAANTIFLLRKRRIELITGDVGENVFGAGLKAALDEIDRQEQAYLELFLGKQTLTTTTVRFDVAPQSGKTTYIICRFSDTQGAVPANDLSGRPIVLELDPTGTVSTEGLAIRTDKDTRAGVTFRIADNVNCKLLDDKSMVTYVQLPVFQFGKTVEVAASNRK